MVLEKNGNLQKFCENLNKIVIKILTNNSVEI